MTGSAVTTFDNVFALWLERKILIKVATLYILTSYLEAFFARYGNISLEDSDISPEYPAIWL